MVTNQTLGAKVGLAERTHMSSSTFALRLATDPVVDFTLEQGARRYLQKAIEEEVADYINANARPSHAGGS